MDGGRPGLRLSPSSGGEQTSSPRVGPRPRLGIHPRAFRVPEQVDDDSVALAVPEVIRRLTCAHTSNPVSSCRPCRHWLAIAPAIWLDLGEPQGLSRRSSGFDRRLGEAVSEAITPACEAGNRARAWFLRSRGPGSAWPDRRQTPRRRAGRSTRSEGAFLACSFWLAGNYALSGRLEEAQALFERLLSLRNDLGLLAEEYDPSAGRLLGNFPQAFSHVPLVMAALVLEEAAERGRESARTRGPTSAVS
jgi:hypothetical protein